MDLSTSYYYNRLDKETSAYFRCHKTSHHIRDYLLLDNRP